MANRKNNRVGNMVMIDDPPITISLQEEQTFDKLRSNLAKIKDTPGVIGFILRNTTMAVIDLQNTKNLVEYAILASQATEVCQEISEIFNQNTTKTVVEGTEIKMLCMVIGENRLSVLTEKTLDHTEIFKRISP